MMQHASTVVVVFCCNKLTLLAPCTALLFGGDAWASSRVSRLRQVCRHWLVLVNDGSGGTIPLSDPLLSLRQVGPLDLFDFSL